ncbi:MAG: hypothetical protein AB8G15_15790 [Saprospiraceae bacterium]
MKEKPLATHKPKVKELIFDTPPTFKKLSCPACAAAVAAADINIHDKLAKCHSCAAIFSFEETLESIITRAPITQEVIRPEGIDIFHFKDALDITIQQPITAIEGIALGLIPMLSLMLTGIYFTKDIALVIPVIFWLLTALLMYNLLTRSRQKIHVTVEGGQLSLIWRPKKFHQDRHYKVEEIDQLYVKGYGGYCNVYMIFNGEEGQRHIPLIRGLDSLSKARYLEQELETHLKIKDRAIPEESK